MTGDRRKGLSAPVPGLQSRFLGNQPIHLEQRQILLFSQGAAGFVFRQETASAVVSRSAEAGSDLRGKKSGASRDTPERVPAPDRDDLVTPHVAVGRGMDGVVAHPFGSLAAIHVDWGAGRPMALRPTLSRGLPFRG